MTDSKHSVFTAPAFKALTPAADPPFFSRAYFHAHRPSWKWLLGIFFTLAVLTYVIRLLFLPVTLKIAVGPATGEDIKLVAAMVQAFARDKAPVRLKILLTENPTASAKALEDGLADLAIVRTERALPENSGTVAIMHRDTVMLATPPESALKKVSDFKGKRVGIVPGNAGNIALLNRIVKHSGLEEEDVTKIPLTQETARAAIKEGRVDAIMAVAPLGERHLPNIVTMLKSDSGAAPNFIGIEEAEAMAQIDRTIDYAEILLGSFGGNPSLPAESINTLAISYRLIASRDVSDKVVEDLTDTIFSLRLTLASEVSLANRIAAPSLEKGASLPLHPGATTYYDGQQQSFLERYSDLLYIGLALLGLFASIGIGIANGRSKRNRMERAEEIHHLLALIQQARKAKDNTALSSIETEAESIVERVVVKTESGKIDNMPLIVSLMLGLDELRAIIGRKREEIKGI